MYPVTPYGGGILQTAQGPSFGNYIPQQTPVMQPVVPTPQKPVIYGRVVNQIEEVMVGDVPLDGSSGLYPINDGSAIYTKAWNSDGTIKTVKYVPEIPKEIDVTPTEVDQLKTWLDNKFKELSKSMSRKEAVG